MDNYTVSSSPILCVSTLATALDLSVRDLREALCIPVDQRYELDLLPKSDGSKRKVYKPHHKIRLIQRRINKRILSKSTVVKWPNYIYGSIPNTTTSSGSEIKKDYVTCAGIHCEAKSVLRIDVKDFFNNIHYGQIYDIFKNLFHYSEEVSEILTDLCMRNNALPQGGLTSGYLACLCLYDVEPIAVKRLRNKNLKYTRFVDDIVVSSHNANYDFSFANKLICEMLHSKDLPVNDDKTIIQRISSESIIIHGLRITFKQPRLPVGEAKNIRAAVHNIEKLAAQPGIRTTNSYRKAYNRCVGRVNKLSRVKSNQHKILLNRLSDIKPLATYSTVERTKSRVRKLEKDYENLHTTYWYKVRYFKTQERLNTIQRNFPNIAKYLRERLKKIKPYYNN